MYRHYLKRPLDVVLSLCGLVILSPVMLLTAVLVRWKLGHPVIFRQDRPGKDEKIFTLYKFRSMSDERDQQGNLLPESARLTPFGRMLRSTSLDELPELVNILKGEMSLIGPRPLLIRYLPYYTATERLRHSVRPGLSGLAQINGRNNLEWNSRLALDVEYVNRLSFLLDMKLIFLSLIKAIKGDDVVVVGTGTMLDLDQERSGAIDNRRTRA